MQSRFGKLGYTLVAVTAAVISIAGLIKLFNLPAFRTSLDSWSLVPEMTRGTFAVLIPVIELIVGGLWFIRPTRIRFWSIGALLVVFTVVYLLHLLTVGAPDCGCLGKLNQYLEWQDSIGMVLIRNATLLVLWGIGGLFIHRFSACKSTVQRSALPSRSGFTLIETIVVVMLVGILTLLVLPSLSNVRNSSMELVTTARIRSHTSIFTLYATENAGYYPSLVHPQASSATYTVRGEPLTILGYFGQIYVWQFGLSDPYYDGTIEGPLFRRAGNDSDWIVPDYRYSASFMADPAFWSAETRTGPGQWRGQRSSSVRYPSSKALLTDDRAMVFGSDGFSVFALSDGSAMRVSLNEVAPPHRTGEGEYPGTANVVGFPGIHTINGIYGRDVP